MSELFEQLKPQALDSGITIFSFWNMTYGEIVDVIASANRQRLNQLKERASFDHILADLVGASVGRLMDKNAKFPTLYDSYPTLFKDEISKKEVEAPQEEWKLYKARLMKYATAHNEKQRRGESNNSRRASNTDNS